MLDNQITTIKANSKNTLMMLNSMKVAVNLFMDVHVYKPSLSFLLTVIFFFFFFNTLF